MQDKIRKITFLAALAAFAIILGYVEALIPFNFGIPGIKLGLANLVIVIMLFADSFSFGFKDILVVNIIRIVIVGIIFSNVYGIVYSLCGGLISFFVMYIIKRTGAAGVLGVSIIGGVTHNLAQLLVAMVVVEQLKVIYYAPVLLLSGSICGAVIGVAGGILASRINKIKIDLNN